MVDIEDELTESDGRLSGIQYLLNSIGEIELFSDNVLNNLETSAKDDNIIKARKFIINNEHTLREAKQTLLFLFTKINQKTFAGSPLSIKFNEVNIKLQKAIQFCDNFNSKTTNAAVKLFTVNPKSSWTSSEETVLTEQINIFLQEQGLQLHDITPEIIHTVYVIYSVQKEKLTKVKHIMYDNQDAINLVNNNEYELLYRSKDSFITSLTVIEWVASVKDILQLLPDAVHMETVGVPSCDFSVSRTELVNLRTWLTYAYGALTEQEKLEISAEEKDISSEPNVVRFIEAQKFLDELLGSNQIADKFDNSKKYNFQQYKLFLRQAINASKTGEVSSIIGAAAEDDNLTIIEKFYLVKEFGASYPGSLTDISSIYNKLYEKIPEDNKEFIYDKIVDVIFEFQNDKIKKLFIIDLIKKISDPRLMLKNKSYLFLKILEKAKQASVSLNDLLSLQDLNELVKEYNNDKIDYLLKLNLINFINDCVNIGADDKYKLLISIKGITRQDIENSAPTVLKNLNFFTRFNFLDLLDASVDLKTLSDIISSYESQAKRWGATNQNHKILIELKNIQKKAEESNGNAVTITSRLLQLIFFHTDDVSQDVLKKVLKHKNMDQKTYGKIIKNKGLFGADANNYPQQIKAIEDNKSLLSKVYNYITEVFYNNLTGDYKLIADTVYYDLYQNAEDLKPAELAALDLLYLRLLKDLDNNKNNLEYNLENFIKNQQEQVNKKDAVLTIKDEMKNDLHHWAEDEIDGISSEDLISGLNNGLGKIEKKIEDSKTTAKELIEKTIGDGNPSITSDAVAIRNYLSTVENQITSLDNTFLDEKIQEYQNSLNQRETEEQKLQVELRKCNVELEENKIGTEEYSTAYAKRDAVVRASEALKLKYTAEVELLKKYFKQFLPDSLKLANTALKNSEEAFFEKIIERFYLMDDASREIENVIKSVQDRIIIAENFIKKISNNEKFKLNDYLNNNGIILNYPILVDSKIYSYVFITAVKKSLQDRLIQLELIKEKKLELAKEKLEEDREKVKLIQVDEKTFNSDQSLILVKLAKLQEVKSKLDDYGYDEAKKQRFIDFYNAKEQELLKYKSQAEQLFDGALTETQELKDNTDIQNHLNYLQNHANKVEKRGFDEVGKLNTFEARSDSFKAQKIANFNSIVSKIDDLNKLNLSTIAAPTDITEPRDIKYYEIGYKKGFDAHLITLRAEQKKYAEAIAKDIAQEVLTAELKVEEAIVKDIAKQELGAELKYDDFIKKIAKYLTRADSLVNPKDDIAASGVVGSTAEESAIYDNADFLAAYKTAIKQVFTDYLKKNQKSLAAKVINELLYKIINDSESLDKTLDDLNQFLQDDNNINDQSFDKKYQRTFDDIKNFLKDDQTLNALDSVETFRNVLAKAFTDWRAGLTKQKQKVKQFVQENLAKENIYVLLQQESEKHTNNWLYSKLLAFELKVQLKDKAKKMFEEQILGLLEEKGGNIDLVTKISDITTEEQITGLMSLGLNENNRKILKGFFDKSRDKLVYILNKFKQHLEVSKTTDTENFLNDKIIIHEDDEFYKNLNKFYKKLFEVVYLEQKNELLNLINTVAENLRAKVLDKDIATALYNAQPGYFSNNILKGLTKEQIKEHVSDNTLHNDIIFQKIAAEYESKLKARDAAIKLAEQAAEQEIVVKAESAAIAYFTSNFKNKKSNYNANQLGYAAIILQSQNNITKGNYVNLGVKEPDYNTIGYWKAYSEKLDILLKEEKKTLPVATLAAEAAQKLFDSNKFGEPTLDPKNPYQFFEKIIQEYKQQDSEILASFANIFKEFDLTEISGLKTEFIKQYKEKLKSLREEEAKSIAPLMAASFFEKFFNENTEKFVKKFSENINGLTEYVANNFIDSTNNLGPVFEIGEGEDSVSIKFEQLNNCFNMSGFKQEFKSVVGAAKTKYDSFFATAKETSAIQNELNNEKSNKTAKKDLVYIALLNIRLEYETKLANQKLYDKLVAEFQLEVDKAITKLNTDEKVSLENINDIKVTITNLKAELENKNTIISGTIALKEDFDRFDVAFENKHKLLVKLKKAHDAIKSFKEIVQREIDRIKAAKTLEDLNEIDKRLLEQRKQNVLSELRTDNLEKSEIEKTEAALNAELLKFDKATNDKASTIQEAQRLASSKFQEKQDIDASKDKLQWFATLVDYKKKVDGHQYSDLGIVGNTYNKHGFNIAFNAKSTELFDGLKLNLKKEQVNILIDQAAELLFKTTVSDPLSQEADNYKRHAHVQTHIDNIDSTDSWFVSGNKLIVKDFVSVFNKKFAPPNTPLEIVDLNFFSGFENEFRDRYLGKLKKEKLKAEKDNRIAAEQAKQAKIKKSYENAALAANNFAKRKEIQELTTATELENIESVIKAAEDAEDAKNKIIERLSPEDKEKLIQKMNKVIKTAEQIAAYSIAQKEFDKEIPKDNLTEDWLQWFASFNRKLGISGSGREFWLAYKRKTIELLNEQSDIINKLAEEAANFMIDNHAIESLEEVTKNVQTEVDSKKHWFLNYFVERINEANSSEDDYIELEVKSLIGLKGFADALIHKCKEKLAQQKESLTTEESIKQSNNTAETNFKIDNAALIRELEEADSNLIDAKAEALGIKLNEFVSNIETQYPNANKKTVKHKINYIIQQAKTKAVTIENFVNDFKSDDKITALNNVGLENIIETFKAAVAYRDTYVSSLNSKLEDNSVKLVKSRVNKHLRQELIDAMKKVVDEFNRQAKSDASSAKTLDDIKKIQDNIAKLGKGKHYLVGLDFGSPDNKITSEELENFLEKNVFTNINNALIKIFAENALKPLQIATADNLNSLTKEASELKDEIAKIISDDVRAAAIKDMQQKIAEAISLANAGIKAANENAIKDFCDKNYVDKFKSLKAEKITDNINKLKEELENLLDKYIAKLDINNNSDRKTVKQGILEKINEAYKVAAEAVKYDSKTNQAIQDFVKNKAITDLATADLDDFDQVINKAIAHKQVYIASLKLTNNGIDKSKVELEIQKALQEKLITKFNELVETFNNELDSKIKSAKNIRDIQDILQHEQQREKLEKIKNKLINLKDIHDKQDTLKNVNVISQQELIGLFNNADAIINLEKATSNDKLSALEQEAVKLKDEIAKIISDNKIKSNLLVGLQQAIDNATSIAKEAIEKASESSVKPNELDSLPVSTSTPTLTPTSQPTSMPSTPIPTSVPISTTPIATSTPSTPTPVLTQSTPAPISTSTSSTSAPISTSTPTSPTPTPLIPQPVPDGASITEFIKSINNYIKRLNKAANFSDIQTIITDKGDAESKFEDLQLNLNKTLQKQVDLVLERFDNSLIKNINRLINLKIKEIKKPSVTLAQIDVITKEVDNFKDLANNFGLEIYDRFYTIRNRAAANLRFKEHKFETEKDLDERIKKIDDAIENSEYIENEEEKIIYKDLLNKAKQQVEHLLNFEDAIDNLERALSIEDIPDLKQAVKEAMEDVLADIVVRKDKKSARKQMNKQILQAINDANARLKPTAAAPEDKPKPAVVDADAEKNYKILLEMANANILALKGVVEKLNTLGDKFDKLDPLKPKPEIKPEETVPKPKPEIKPDTDIKPPEIKPEETAPKPINTIDSIIKMIKKSKDPNILLENINKANDIIDEDSIILSEKNKQKISEAIKTTVIKIYTNIFTKNSPEQADSLVFSFITPIRQILYNQPLLLANERIVAESTVNDLSLNNAKILMRKRY